MTETMREDVQQRLQLIESMMLEGRRSTEYWGWSFVLWGVAYLMAIVWSYFSPGHYVVWTVTMVGAGLLTAAIGAVKSRGKPDTTLARGIGAGWSAVGISLFTFCFCAAISGWLEIHSFVAAVESFLAVANFVSGTALRWRIQQVIAAMWWTVSGVTFFVRPSMVVLLLVGAIFLGNICFGIYLMVREMRDKAKARAGQVLHA